VELHIGYPKFYQVYTYRRYFPQIHLGYYKDNLSIWQCIGVSKINCQVLSHILIIMIF
jgi:hypothetical protein